MVFSTLLAFYLFFITEQATAMALGPERRGLQVCFANEAKTLFCYKKPQGTPQDIKVADMVYAAKALREYGTGTQMKLDTDGNPVLDENGIPIEVPLYRFLNMTTSTASECGEWTIFSDAETVLVTAKLMTKKTNGLVWFGDIASTIDGGEGATADEQKKAIVSCGTDGGSREVNANTTHEAYAQYKSLYDSGAYVAGQIVVKVVQNLDWKHANPSS